MVSIVHESKRAKNSSRRRASKASDCNPTDGGRIPIFGVHCKKEGLAAFTIYSGRHWIGDREVSEVNSLESESMECSTTPPTLTSLPGLEEGMAKPILHVVCLHIIHQSNAHPAGIGGEIWA